MSMPYIEQYRDGRHKCWKDLWIVRPIFLTIKLLVKTTVRRPITVLYPYEALWNPDNYRGRPGLDFNKCLGCGMCVKYCPCTAIILVDTPDDEGNTVSRPQVNMGRCSFCGYCAEYCPVDAMTVTPIVELAEYTRADLIYGPRRLAYEHTTEGMKIKNEVTLLSDYQNGKGEIRHNFFGLDQPELDGNKCISCKKCQKACPVGAIEMVEHGKNAKGKAILWPEISSDKCVSCQNCIDACPKDALTLKEVY
jgi:NADH-quinone oxidoreductase subunit I